MQPTITPVNCDECELQCARVCVIIVLTVQWACNQTCSGRFHSAINGGVCGPGGENWWIWLAEEEGKLPSTFAVFLLLDHVFVCLHTGTRLLFAHTVSLHLSHSLLRGVNESRESQWEGEGGREVTLGRKRVRKGMRWDLSSGVWSWCFGILSWKWCIQGRKCEGIW